MIKQFIYILIIFVGLVSSCSLGDNKPRSISRLPEPDIMERLEGQKNIIDTQFQQNKNKIIVLAKPFANDEPMQIGREDVPNIVNSVFSILKDSSGQIIAAYETLRIGSDGEFVPTFLRTGRFDGLGGRIVLAHYFDEYGRTFAFERQVNGIFTEGTVHEIRTKYYDDHFRLMDETYKLVDDENKNLPKDSYQFLYDHEHKISADVDEYLRTNRIKTAGKSTGSRLSDRSGNISKEQ